MAHGFSLTRHDGLAAYAEALAAAGAHVVVFDHRYLGDSGGSDIANHKDEYIADAIAARKLER